LADQGLVRPPEDFIQKEVAYAFISGFKEQEMKQRLLMSIEKSLNKIFNQSLQRVATRVAIEHQQGCGKYGLKPP
jgi:hypothetical protein